MSREFCRHKRRLVLLGIPGSLFGFSVLLIREFRKGLGRMFKDSFIRVGKKNSRAGKL